MVLKSHNTNNPIVFLDIRIGPEKGKSRKYIFLKKILNNCFFFNSWKTNCGVAKRCCTKDC